MGDDTFVPNELPPAINWTSPLASIVSEAGHALGQLSGLGRKIVQPQRLARLFLRREAELSSRIENTYAGVQTMLLAKQDAKVNSDAETVKEVENNFNALEFAVASIPARRLGTSLIKEMHAILLKGVRGQDKTPGQFRPVQAHIGSTNLLSEARFVPTAPHLVDPCMESLERYLRDRDDLPPVVRVAIAHYQFEAIHPFADGNGRVGRVLLLVQLITEGVLSAPLLNPSAPLERDRRGYYDRLLMVSRDGQWTQWIEFFCAGLRDEANASIARVERIEALRDRYHQTARSLRASSLLPQLIDWLFVEPAVTTNGVAAALDIQFSSARNLLDRLLQAGIIREVTGRARDRVFLAQEIVDQFKTGEEN